MENATSCADKEKLILEGILGSVGVAKGVAFYSEETYSPAFLTVFICKMSQKRESNFPEALWLERFRPLAFSLNRSCVQSCVRKALPGKENLKWKSVPFMC